MQVPVMTNSDRPPLRPSAMNDPTCQQMDFLHQEEHSVVNWLYKDIDALDYFAGDVERIPPNIWEYLDKLRTRRGEELYPDLLMALIHRRFSAEEAKTLWLEIVEHKYFMSQKMGRNVGIRVATLDFLHNHSGLVRDLRLLPEHDLDCLLLFVNEDGLTGVYNHRYFQEQLRHELARTKRYHRPMSLLLLDLDHFKNFNDRYGHRQGDQLLKEAAEFFDRSKREADTVARYGGDEFAIILPETGHEEALVFAKRLRADFETAHLGQFVKDENGVVTISVGVASHPDNGTDAETLIELADQALYRAKHAGRNCIRSAKTAS
jgi:diguanylate cyclase (GGDEF)-like protein